MCSAQYGCFLQLLNFVLSRSVAQVLSEWFWDGSSRPCYCRYHFWFYIQHALNFCYKLFILLLLLLYPCIFSEYSTRNSKKAFLNKLSGSLTPRTRKSIQTLLFSRRHREMIYRRHASARLAGENRPTLPTARQTNSRIQISPFGDSDVRVSGSHRKYVALRFCRH